MTQLTLNIENPAVLPSLKKLLAFVDGVSVAHERKTSAAQPDDVERKALRSALRQVKRIQAGRIETRPVEALLNEY